MSKRDLTNTKDHRTRSTDADCVFVRLTASPVEFTTIVANSTTRWLLAEKVTLRYLQFRINHGFVIHNEPLIAGIYECFEHQQLRIPCRGYKARQRIVLVRVTYVTCLSLLRPVSKIVYSFIITVYNMLSAARLQCSINNEWSKVYDDLIFIYTVY